MRRAAAILVACTTACTESPSGIRAAPRPVIESATIAPGTHNVLSAMVTITAQHAESVRVRFHAVESPSEEEATPAWRTVDGLAAVPVLGLRAERRYIARAVAYGARTTIESDPLELTTGALPPDLPRFTASGTDPLPGYLVFAAARYGIVIDNAGRVAWYRHFPNGVGLSFMAQPSGTYVARPPTPIVGDLEPWVGIDAMGNLTRSMSCVGGLPSRPHDLIVAPDGSYHILCDETRTMDLTAVGGVASARVTGTVIQRVSAAGDLLFAWSSFDHFTITDVPLAERIGASVNWTHGNALELDDDGNLLVSFRNLGEITRIDGRTGAVIWRMGGLRNQFTFIGTAAPAFARQHSVRSPGRGTLVLLDNLGDAQESRAERYVIDEPARTVSLVHSYGSVPRVVTEIGGSVQPLDNGHTLVSFGTAGRVEEYDATGRVVWSIHGNPGYVFRAQRIRSLYQPGAGTAR